MSGYGYGVCACSYSRIRYRQRRQSRSAGVAELSLSLSQHKHESIVSSCSESRLRSPSFMHPAGAPSFEILRSASLLPSLPRLINCCLRALFHNLFHFQVAPHRHADGSFSTKHFAWIGPCRYFDFAIISFRQCVLSAYFCLLLPLHGPSSLPLLIPSYPRSLPFQKSQSRAYLVQFFHSPSINDIYLSTRLDRIETINFRVPCTRCPSLFQDDVALVCRCLCQALVFLSECVRVCYIVPCLTCASGL